MTRILSTIVALSMAVGCAPPRPASPVPAAIDYVSRSQWGAAPPVAPVRPHTLSRLTLHHTGTPQDTARSLEEKMVALQRFSQTEAPLADGRMKPIWADIPYHFYVGVDGRVAEGRELAYAGDTNTSYDPAGHLLVVVEGNFESDTLTAAQRHTLEILVPALARRWGIPAERLAAHRDFASTLCPGENLYQQLPRLRMLLSRR